MTKYDRTLLRKRARVLYIDGNTLYAQIGNRLCTSDDNGLSWQNYPIKLPCDARAYSRIHARLMRRGIHSLNILSDGKILLVAKNVICVYSPDKTNVVESFSIPRGSRPLFVCENQEGDLFWGEYFRNKQRENVNIFMSCDQGRSWQVVFEFGEKSIRHVHGIFCDPYDDRIWVTTGDEDHESAIWVTEDKFKTLEKVIGGSQQFRALQLLFTNEHVYFGTDTPFAKNHIYRLHKNSGKVEKLASVDSSVYWGCKVNDTMFFSTAVEPSTINRDKFASIWGSRDGTNWKLVARYKKDIWPARYCQIGQVYLPQGKNITEYLFYTPVATDCDMTLQKVRIADVIQ